MTSCNLSASLLLLLLKTSVSAAFHVGSTLFTTGVGGGAVVVVGCEGGGGHFVMWRKLFSVSAMIFLRLDLICRNCEASVVDPWCTM